MKACRLFLLIYLIVYAATAYCQNNNGYALNMYNGLPSNHVYAIVSDSDGYLWMSTTNGVVRYNGYNCKVYNTSQGLPRNDIFGLYIDNKNRIWLRCIAYELGYIKQGKYHQTIKQGVDSGLYPKYISTYNNGIFFSSYYKGATGLFLEKNDTIYPMSYLYSGIRVGGHNELVDFNEGRIDRYSLNNAFQPQLLSSCISNFKNTHQRPLKTDLFQNHFVFYSDNTNELRVFNTRNCEERNIALNDANGVADNICFLNHFADFSSAISPKADKLVVICERNIYLFDTSINLLSRIDISKTLNGNGIAPGRSVVNFYENNFWGRSLATKTNGLHIDYGPENNFHKIDDLNLSTYKLLGSVGGQVSYWWDESKKNLVTIDESGKYHQRNTPEFEGAVKLIEYRRGNSLLLTTSFRIKYYDHETKDLRPLKGLQEIRPVSLYDFVLGMDSQIYFTAHGIGLSKLDIHPDTAYVTSIDRNWYRGIAYDPFRSMVLTYFVDKVLLHTKTGSLAIPADVLQKSGISSVEKILVDNRYGNHFLKDYNNLFLLDYNKRKMAPLFWNYNFRDAQFSVSNDKIILAGQFGVLFSKIIAKGKFSQPIVYPNIKNFRYRVVEEISVLQNTVILKTDKGVFTVNMPHDTMFQKASSWNLLYKALLTYKNDIHQLPFNDTLAIDQKEYRFQLDIINPLGNGTLRYYYKIRNEDTAWHELSNNELYLPKLVAGKYYTLSVIAYDDVWRSNMMNIRLYVVPYWWQTLKGTYTIAALGILIISLLLVWVIWLTRRHIMRTNQKKWLMTELELRAVYSQLNPHFIFNTLNSALHFIRKKRTEEAVEHVSKFSDLLRAYLDSSRKRMISIADEIVNLRNYIELQQVRFGNSFTYEINISDIPNASTIYIPSLLLQPIVENAINHGVLLLEDRKGHIDISFSGTANADTVICTIDDNGVGRARSKALKNDFLNKKSYGNELVGELVELLNRHTNLGISISYTDKENDMGTLVTLKIKTNANGE